MAIIKDSINKFSKFYTNKEVSSPISFGDLESAEVSVGATLSPDTNVREVLESLNASIDAHNQNTAYTKYNSTAASSISKFYDVYVAGSYLKGGPIKIDPGSFPVGSVFELTVNTAAGSASTHLEFKIICQSIDAGIANLSFSGNVTTNIAGNIFQIYRDQYFKADITKGFDIDIIRYSGFHISSGGYDVTDFTINSGMFGQIRQFLAGYADKIVRLSIRKI